MRCSHNYVYTQGHFYCTKCGKRTYGSSHKRNSRKIGLGILAASVVGIAGFLFFNDTIEFNQENLEKTLESLPKEIPEITLEPPKIPLLENVPQIIPEIKNEEPKNTKTPNTSLDLAKIELLIHEKTNIQRTLQGLSPLEYDAQISDIARMHSQDMAINNYFEHKSPSGKEPWDRGLEYGYDKCGSLEAISLQNKYDEISRQYDQYPRQATSESQYQQGMALYSQLNTINAQLNFHIENKELFGGLAENIAQDWTYDSVTYWNRIASYDWNTEEKIAQQTVDGWMESQGHRENILSGFHSEGIGVAVASDDKVYITQNFC